uniref:Fibronectin type-III domain-containing protein n=1 Tax=Echeneis naucrates TaxID=173247 RepID=A0A665U9X2_ECHNA
MAAVFGRVSVIVTLLVCFHGGQAQHLLTGDATSDLDSAPTPAVHCWCATYPNVTLCSWPEPPQSPPTHYVATYSERHNQSVTKQCHLIPPLWYCRLPNLKLLTDYIINVTAVYSGKSSSHLASFMLEEIVKPDPPEDVRVYSHDIRDLVVEWSTPSTWANLDIFPLKYHIKYQWENRGTLKIVNLGPLENTRVVLKQFIPGKTYLFQVCAMELLGLGKCSNWSSAVNVTVPVMKP